jgi:hypothetical protein
MNLATIHFNGHNLRPDENGNLNLTDFWRAAGSPHKKEPGIWKNQKGNKAFIAHILNTHKKGGLPIIVSKAGRHGSGTVAHPQIALAYAKFLNHELHALVNATFFERVKEEANPELIVERAVKTFRRRGLSDEQISARIQGVQARNKLTEVCGKHGVRDAGFRDITNAIYMPLLGGTAADVRKAQGLPVKANVRDSLSVIELRTLELAELVSADNIQNKRVFGNQACASVCYQTAAEISGALVRSRR